MPAWFALYAPGGTPAEIVDRINKKANELSASADMKARLQIVAAVPIVQTQDEIRAYMEKDRASLAQLIKVANIKFE